MRLSPEAEKRVCTSSWAHQQRDLPVSHRSLDTVPLPASKGLLSLTSKWTTHRTNRQALKGYVKTNPEAGVYLVDKGVLSPEDVENAHQKGLQIIGWSIVAGIVILLALSALGIFLMSLR